MRHEIALRRHLAVLLILGLVAATCGGGDGSADDGPDEPAPTGGSGTVVVSDDGLVEQEIPPGAVPDGTEISVTAGEVPDSLRVPGADVFVYDLQPSGLQFDGTATLAMTVPRQVAGIVIGVAAVGSGPDDLEHLPSAFVVQGGVLTITTEISHFSTYVSWIGGEEITVIDECPEQLIVGGPFCQLYVPDIEQHPALTVSVRVPPSSQQFFSEWEERVDGSALACQNPTDELRALAVLEVFVSDWTLEELFRLVGAKLEYKGGAIDDFEYWNQADCIVDESFFEDDPASQIPGGVAETTTDPTGDFLAEADLLSRGFELVEQDPPPGVDITAVAVAYAPGGDVTEITVCFAGPARSLAGEDRSLSIRPIFRRNGEYFFEADYRNGEVHLSGGPNGATVTYTWTAADKIRFRIEGFAPGSGDEVRVSVFSEVSTDAGKAVQGDDATVAIP